jgi:chromosome partitioning protein
MLAIGCLSQKGGVGKSTISRLIARTYAAADWKVKIADFNLKQKTCVDWAALRMEQHIEPEVPAEAFSDVAKAMQQGKRQYDLMVCDGKPDSDTSTIRIAEEANLVIIPCGVTSDDLVPQVRFGQELKMRGVLSAKMVYVINKSARSQIAVNDARRFIASAGFACCDTDLPMTTGYQMAQNTGRCLVETGYATLNEKAEQLAQEIVDRLTQLTGR